MVVEQSDLAALGNQPSVLEVPAQLVVEIVSESSKTDDYLYKLTGYRGQAIPEFWVVDYLGLGAGRYIVLSKGPTLSVYRLVNGEYQMSQFQGSDPIFSPMALTAEQVFRGER